eukprot:3917454-Amphidinium_carterae.1
MPNVTSMTSDIVRPSSATQGWLLHQGDDTQTADCKCYQLLQRTTQTAAMHRQHMLQYLGIKTCPTERSDVKVRHRPILVGVLLHTICGAERVHHCMCFGFVASVAGRAAE